MEGTAEEIQKQIEQRVGELPADVQNAIFSADFGTKINEIGADAKLHLDQIQELNDFTMLVMLGFMNEDEYRKEVTALVGSEAIAQKIISDVNSKIFLSIRESMKKFAAGQGGVTPSALSKPALSEILPKESTVTTVMNASPVVPLVPKVDMHPADVMLNEKTVSKPIVDTKAAAPKPQDYKADPYREPIA